MTKWQDLAEMDGHKKLAEKRFEIKEVKLSCGGFVLYIHDKNKLVFHQIVKVCTKKEKSEVNTWKGKDKFNSMRWAANLIKNMC